LLAEALGESVLLEVGDMAAESNHQIAAEKRKHCDQAPDPAGSTSAAFRPSPSHRNRRACEVSIGTRFLRPVCIISTRNAAKDADGCHPLGSLVRL